MKNILFVDDEQQVLDAMRNMLRKRRKEWNMAFVNSGAAALQELEQKSYDVIVSDMRMPVMDGAELLEQVRGRFPQTARFVLSGQADVNSIFRVLPYSQQFLSKPCDPVELNRVIEKTNSLQEDLGDDEVRRAVGGVRFLPSSGPVYQRFLQELERPNARVEEVAAIIECDPAMSAKVLQLVNSAYFGSIKRTSSIQQAVSFLGFDLLRMLASLPTVFSTVNLNPKRMATIEQIQRGSIETARLAVLLIEQAEFEEPAYSAALLHRVGLLAKAKILEHGWDEMIAMTEMTHRSLSDLEAQLGEVSHSMVGAYLLGVWGLPEVIVETAAFYGKPMMASECHREIVIIVHAAAALVEAASMSGVSLTHFLDIPSIEAAGFADRIEVWIQRFQRNRANLSRDTLGSTHFQIVR